MSYYLFLFITLAITMGAQTYMNSQYNKCTKIANKAGMNGVDTAHRIIKQNSLGDIAVLRNQGTLTDYYDPKNKLIRLSDGIYGDATIAAVSVAAHECGHALQDKEGYFFLRFRRSILPFVNFASMAGYIAILIGAFAGALQIFWFGIICEMVILLFQLVTLPVEFNASRRGLEQLRELNIVDEDEIPYCKGMLRAAALTYVAGVATALLNVLRLVAIARRRD